MKGCTRDVYQIFSQKIKYLKKKNILEKIPFYKEPFLFSHSAISKEADTSTISLCCKTKKK